MNQPHNLRSNLLRSAMNTGFSYCPAACAVAIAAVSAVSAQSISLNFGADQEGGAIDTTAGANPAGAVPISGEFWNNIEGGSGTIDDDSIIDDTGAAVPGLELSWDSANTWTSASPGATATSENGALTTGYLDDGSGWSVQFLKAPYLVQDVYVIHATDQGDPAEMSAVSINGTYYIGDGEGGTIPAAGSGSSWNADNWTDADALTESDHYIKSLAEPGANVSAENASPGRAALAGLQIVNAYSGTVSYWDPNGADPGSGDGGDGDLDGTWGTDAFWSTDASGESATGTWTAGHAAAFSAGGDGFNFHDITVTGTQAADAVWIQEGAYSFVGDGVIDLTGGIGLIRNDDPLPVIIDTQIDAGDLSAVGLVDLNNTGNNITGTVTVNGSPGDLLLGGDNTFAQIGGGGDITILGNSLTAGNDTDSIHSGTIVGESGSSFTKTGTGSLTLGNAPTGLDSVEIADGVLRMGAGQLDSELTGSGGLTKTGGGTLILGSTDNSGFTGQLSVEGGVLAGGASLSFGAAPGSPVADGFILDGGRLSGEGGSGGADLTIPAERGITINGGQSGFETLAGFTTTVDAPIVNGNIQIDDGEGGTVTQEGTLAHSGGGTAIINGGSTHLGDTLIQGGTLDVRSEVPNTGEISMTGTSQLNIGTGATITAERLQTSDGGGAMSTIEHTDGVLNITGTNNTNSTSASFHLGHWGAGEASTVYNLSGGELNSLGAHLSLGWDSADVVVNQTGGTANLLGIDLDNGRNNAATYNLEGGELNLGANGISTNASKTINLGGATLGSLSSWTTGQGLVLTGVNGDASFAPAAGHTIGITGDVSGPAGLTIDGAGIVSLGGAGTYEGTTTVNSGTLRVADTGPGVSPVTVASGATIGAGSAVGSGAGTVETLVLESGSSSAFRLNFASPDTLNIAATDGLTINGPHSITAVPQGELLPGDQFTLIDYEGAIQGGGFADLSIDPLANPHIETSLIDNTENTSVDLEIVDIDTVTWTGATDGVWDIDGTGNWELSSDMSTSNFFDLDGVTFADGASNTDITIDGPVQPSSVIFEHTSGTFTFSGDAIAGGTSMFIDAPGGTVALQNDNTFTGPIDILAGTLQIGDGTSGSVEPSVEIVNSDTLIVNPPDGGTFENTVTNDGTMELAGTGDLSLDAAITGVGTLDINREGTVDAISGALPSLPATVNVSGGTTLRMLNTAFGGDRMEGEGVLTVQPGGTLEIVEPHAFGGYTGNTDAVVLEDSTMTMTRENYFGPVTLDGGLINGANQFRIADNSNVVVTGDAPSTIEAEINQVFASTFSVEDVTGDASADLIVDGVISDTSALNKIGAGTVLTNAVNTNTGPVNITEGTLEIAAGASFADSSLLSTGTGAVIDATAFDPDGLPIPAGQALGGNGTFDGSAAISGTVAPGLSAGELTVTGSVDFGEGSGYGFEIADWTGAAGTGYDTLTADSISFSATPENPFTITISEDELANFDESGASFTIATATSGITGFDPAAVAFNTDGFGGFGTWEASIDGNDLVLDYAPGSNPYLAFEEANGIAGDGPEADSDGDGIPNGIEFVLGTDSDPTSATNNSSGELPTATTDPDNLYFVFRRSDESAALEPFVEYGSDLTGWTAAEDGTDGVTITEEDDAIDTGIDRVTVTIPRTLATDAKIFARLRVDILEE